MVQCAARHSYTASTGTDRPHTPRAIEMIENMAERASGQNYLSDKYIACLHFSSLLIESGLIFTKLLVYFLFPLKINLLSIFPDSISLEIKIAPRTI